MQLKPLSSGKLQDWMSYLWRYTKRFLDILRGPLLACFNHSYINGRLLDTQQEGLISLLLKQDPSGKYKDPVHLKNWWPLTLRCCDAKILAKCLAHRI